jgi:hypothetical protein
MPDEELIDTFGVPEIFVDGFTKHSARDGIMSCVGFRHMADGPTVVVRLVWPIVNTDAAIEDAKLALAAPELPAVPSTGSKRGVH